MNNDQILLLELTKSDAEDLIEALDTVVKSNGISVAERCAQLHKLILTVRPKPFEPPPAPQKYVPTPEEQIKIKEMAESKLQKELDQLIEETPKVKTKKKTSTKKKTTKKK